MLLSNNHLPFIIMQKTTLITPTQKSSSKWPHSCTIKSVAHEIIIITWYCMGFLWISKFIQPRWGISLLHLLHAIACAHARTHTISLMRVKNSTCHFCLWHLLSGTLEQRKWKKETRTSNLINDYLNNWS